jgi:hypothetical protein
VIRRRLLYEISTSDPQPAGSTLSRMQFATLETAALAYVNDSRYFGVYCGKFKHSARLSLGRLRVRLGDDFPLYDVREKLRCRRCRSRHIVNTSVGPHQRSGSLSQLFDLQANWTRKTHGGWQP